MKRARLKARSKKTSAKYVERRKLVERLLKERPRCEAQVPDVCTGKSVHLHERLARSQGGDILDPEQSGIITVCFECHWWIGTEVKKATEMGLRWRRYGRGQQDTD